MPFSLCRLLEISFYRPLLLFIRFCDEIFSGIFYTVHSLVNRVPSFALHLLLDIHPPLIPWSLRHKTLVDTRR